MFEGKHPYGTLFTIAIIAGMVLWFAGGSRIKDSAPFYIKKVLGETAQVIIKNNIWAAEVAKTPKAREKGLAGREHLGVDKGMLFVFEEVGYYTFWMRGMEMSIDIIFIKDNKVVDLVVRAPESTNDGVFSYTPTKEINYVFEARPGSINRYNIRIGDTVKITFD